MKSSLLSTSSILALLMVGSFSAEAALVSFASRAAFDSAFPASVVESWDTYANGTIFLDGTTTNGITYNSSAGNAVVTSSFFNTTEPFSLGDTATGFFNSSDSITFTFAAPMMAFGIDLNTFANTAGAYLATTNTAEVGGSVFDPFPTRSTGQFLGFSSDIAFTSVTVSGTGVNPFSLDSLRAVAAAPVGGGSPIPEPSTALFGLALVGMISASRRRGQR